MIYQTLTEIFKCETLGAKSNKALYVRFPEGIKGNITVIQALRDVELQHAEPSLEEATELFLAKTKMTFGFYPEGVKSFEEDQDHIVYETLNKMISVLDELPDQKQASVEELTWDEV